jgi:hypothetical protein
MSQRQYRAYLQGRGRFLGPLVPSLLHRKQASFRSNNEHRIESDHNLLAATNEDSLESSSMYAARPISAAGPPFDSVLSAFVHSPGLLRPWTSTKAGSAGGNKVPRQDNLSNQGFADQTRIN